MALYKAIWSPAGDFYEVTPELANELVLNKGWFNTKPVVHAEPEIVGDDEAPKPIRKVGKSGDKPPKD